MAQNLINLSISDLEKIKKQKKDELNKKYSEYRKKQKLIDEINRMDQALKKEIIPKTKSKTKTKTFEEYFQECIKNKTIPPDTPPYLRKALERALKEYDQGIISSLDEFANKYIVKGETDILPFEFFRSKSTYLKDFLRNHRNIKVRFVLVCLMEKMEGNAKLNFTVQDKAYFHSDTYINIESSDVKEILTKVIHTILEKISIYQKKGSGWYFKEIVHFEIHTADFNPMRGSSYIPLPDWITRKKALLNIKNKDNKCFLWCVLRYLHPKTKNAELLTDLKQYENSLNTKGIKYPVKIQDISKFEKLNPDLPGINVFSANESSYNRML